MKLYTHEDAAMNQGPRVPIQSVLPKGKPIEDQHVFRSVGEPDGWMVLEWTPAALELIKRDGKRVLVSYTTDNYGALLPSVSYVDPVQEMPQ